MTVELNGDLPLEENEGESDHLKRKSQEENSFDTENVQPSNETDIQLPTIMNNDRISNVIVKTEQLNCSTEDLKLCKTLSDREPVQLTQEEQTSTIVMADIHDSLDQLSRSVNDINTADKTCTENLDPSTSYCSALEMKDCDRNESTKIISELVTSKSTVSNHEEQKMEIHVESTVHKITEENSTNVDTTDSQCISNNAIIQEKQNISPELMQDAAESCRNLDLKLESPVIIDTNRKAGDYNINTDVHSEEKIKDISDQDIILIKEILSSYGNALPQYFHTVAEGLFVHGDSGCLVNSKPTWFDPGKFHLGQEVAMKYFFGLQFAQLLNLLFVLNMPDGLTPLIFSGQSDTPFKAFKRYLSTALRVKSWYTDDLWDPHTEGHKNIRIVRKMHDSIRNKMNATDPQELIKKGTLCARSDTACPAVWSPLHDKLQEDFESTCPYPRVVQNSLIQLHRNHNYVNQTDMAITQFGFVGLFILYPAHFGAHRITNEELEGFLFLWRCIGYLLGMEDKYNFCNGSLEVIKQRSLDLVEHLGKPCLRAVSHDWEHMTRCVTEGVSFYVEGVSFEVSLLYLCNILGLYTPRLRASLTFRQKITYFLTWLTFWVFIRIPGAQNFFNRAVRMNLKRAQTASPTWLRKKEEKKYPFQENGICS